MSSLSGRFREALGKFLNGEAPTVAEHGPDGYPVLADDPLHDAHRQLNALFTEAVAHQERRGGWVDMNEALKDLETGRAILEASREQQIHLLLATLQRRVFLARRRDREKLRWRQEGYTREATCDALFQALMRRRQPFTGEDLAQMAGLFADHGQDLYTFPMGQLFRQLERFVEEHGLDAALREALQGWRDSRYVEEKLRHRLDTLLASAGSGEPEAGLDSRDTWGKTVAEFLDGCGADQRRAWAGLLQLAGQTESASKPSARFLKNAERAIPGIGEDRYRTVLAGWLAMARSLEVQQGLDPYAGYYQAWLLLKPNEIRLRALIWTAPLLADGDLHDELAGLAEHCFTKVPGIGPVAVKLGNACLNTLAELGLPGVASLTVLRERIKHANSRKLLDKLLDEAAGRQGLSRGEIEDLAVADFGLVDGESQHSLGDYRARLRIGDDLKAGLHWESASGKAQKSVPAAVKRDHGAELKALQKTAKTLQTVLTAQRQRLEGFYLARRVLTLGHWRERFADHGLMGCLARRLIWRIGEDRDLLWLDDAWRDADGAVLPELPDHTPVRLWHPLDSDLEAIAHWRALIQQRQIRQPFKQAFREVYLLTDAERHTRTYSNRFAAHLIKQHQFNALRQSRGWRYALQGAWDGSESTPELPLPAWELRAEFWVEAGEPNRIADSGIYLYVGTDQVRFYNADEPAPLALEAIPPLVFSEVLRDVDLFVGVCSVGNDPTWQDQGDNRWRDAWTHFAFGELSASAETRRQVLEGLLPKLKIRDQCELRGRFLHVRGSLRTYKIHLGSSNILMEPNDQYLCIVPERGGAGQKLFLPFEDDATLALILSKAFLLAADGRISDPTILSQIRLRG